MQGSHGVHAAFRHRRPTTPQAHFFPPPARPLRARSRRRVIVRALRLLSPAAAAPYTCRPEPGTGPRKSSSAPGERTKPLSATGPRPPGGYQPARGGGSVISVQSSGVAPGRQLGHSGNLPPASAHPGP